MANSTPAPWLIEKHYDNERRYTPYIKVGPVTIHFTQGYHTPLEDAEIKKKAEANAALVAASPELLEAAKALIEIYGKLSPQMKIGSERRVAWEDLYLAVHRAEMKI